MSATNEELYHVFECGPVKIMQLVGGANWVYIGVWQGEGEWVRAWETPGAPYLEP